MSDPRPEFIAVYLCGHESAPHMARRKVPRTCLKCAPAKPMMAHFRKNWSWPYKKMGPNDTSDFTSWDEWWKGTNERREREMNEMIERMDAQLRINRIASIKAGNEWPPATPEEREAALKECPNT